MNLGQVIKNIRKQKGLTQIKFAEVCQITQTYLSQIESNSKNPNLSTLKMISSKLEVPLPMLFLLSIEYSDILEFEAYFNTLIKENLKEQPFFNIIIILIKSLITIRL